MTDLNILEDLDLADMDMSPVCEGQRLVDWDGTVAQHYCAETAAWIQVVKHCGTRTRLMCTRHKEDSETRTMQCWVCKKDDVPVEWMPL